jgi:hypothetical protein
MFAGYGLVTEEGLIRALGLWSYLASAIDRGQIVALFDPRDPDGDYRVVDLRRWALPISA